MVKTNQENTLKTLSQNLIDIISAELSGKRLEKFMVSVNVVNESLAVGGWTKGSSQKRGVGMTRPNIEVQSEVRYYDDSLTKKQVEEAMTLNKKLREISSFIYWGRPSNFDIDGNLQYVNLKKHSVEFLKAWTAFYVEHQEACKELDLARPLPVVTKVGLSPTVTKTFKEMGLDLDLPSIKLAEIAYRMIPRRNANIKSPEYGEILYDKNGEMIMEREYYVKWSEGIKHGRSRFSARNRQCEACGHGIPSGNYVAIEAFDNNLKNLISLWVGCDCAKNIFGVKDIGIKRSQE